jgi:hypothetical protein
MKTESLVRFSISSLMWMFFVTASAIGQPCAEIYPKHDPPAEGALVLFEAFGDAQPCALVAKDDVQQPTVDLTPDVGLVVDDKWLRDHGHNAEWIAFLGHRYHFHDEGLYRFISMGSSGTNGIHNVIRIRGIEKTESLLALMSGLSKLHVHGELDQANAPPCSSPPDAFLQALKDRLTTGNPPRASLSVQCGYIAGLAKKIMQDNKFANSTRCVNAVGRQADIYDYGHELVEMQDVKTNHWILVDLDLGYVFRDSVGNYMSAEDFWKAAQADRQPQFVPLSKAEIDPNWLDRPWFQWRVWTPRDRWNWYKQVFAVQFTVGPPERNDCWCGPQQNRADFGKDAGIK